MVRATFLPNRDRSKLNRKLLLWVLIRPRTWLWKWTRSPRSAKLRTDCARSAAAGTIVAQEMSFLPAQEANATIATRTIVDAIVVQMATRTVDMASVAVTAQVVVATTGARRGKWEEGCRGGRSVVKPGSLLRFD